MRKNIIALLALAVVVAVGAYAGIAGVGKKSVSSPEISPVAVAEPRGDVEATSIEPAAGDHEQAIQYKGAIMGSDDAPVKIKEFASLSCSHCADFHTGTLPEVKKELIETGRVQFEFIHFPLNASAMDGALISICMPEERYMQFISFLYEQQNKWAFDPNYRNILKQNAKLLGLGEEKLEACLNDEEAKQAIVAKMEEAQTKYNIQSTPSFVINEKETFSGALPFSEFKKKVDAHMPSKGKVDE